MVNFKVESNIVGITIYYIDESKGNSIMINRYPTGLLRVVHATIDGKDYEVDCRFDKIVIRDLTTYNYRALGKRQKRELVEKINYLIREGNDYYSVLVGEQGTPAELNLDM